jgi:TonB-dependent receptor
MHTLSTKRRQLFLAITAASLGLAQGVLAQEADTKADVPALDLSQIEAPIIEEMMVTGRQQTAAQSVMAERIEQPFSADLMDADQISRTGDSNVAVALTRVTGVTLLDGKYIYVRSLGERYSSTLLNGAAVPSPELTRNVLPLDLIPASVVQTLKVQKAWSPDLPANFGGGSVDIRTKTVPEEFLFSLSLGTGLNSESSDGLTHASHGEQYQMPNELKAAIDTYLGNIRTQNIASRLDLNGGSPSAEEVQAASAINRNLMISLNRDVGIYEESLSPDISSSLALGNSWTLNDDFDIGAVFNFSQDSKWRNKDQKTRDVGSPDAIVADIKRTSEETRQLVSTNIGLNYQDAHTLQAAVYHIENIADEARIKTGFDNSTNTLTTGREYIQYETRLENRELDVAQLNGEHKFDQLSRSWLDTPVIDWFYSESTAKTDIPNQVTVNGVNTINTTTGAFISTQLSPASAMASFQFLNLEDDVVSYGWNAKAPLLLDSWEVNLSGGFNHNDKTREYYGYTANIDSSGMSSNVLQGNIDSVLTDAKLLDQNNRFMLTVGGGVGTESYIAAQIVEGAYGMFDAKWNESWRVTAGARYETFKQAVLPINLLDYTGESTKKLIADLQDPNQSYALSEDDWYPSLAVTYMNEGFMNTEVFQVRLSASETVVRPDLREMSDVVYIDPELSFKVQGNSRLVVSDITHYDLRAEWFFDSGNNFTASLFYKDILNPIESTRKPGSDSDVILTFENSLSGEIYGLELEALRDIGAGFFVSSNLTLSDSEIVSEEDVGYTNPKRPMTGQSEYVLNTQLGFDSDDGYHSASLVYNLYGERMFFAARGIGSQQDAYEQPFNSLDLTYSWYATENVTTKIKLGNILNEERSFEQVNSNGENVEILNQTVGTSYSLDFKYTF